MKHHIGTLIYCGIKCTTTTTKNNVVSSNYRRAAGTPQMNERQFFRKADKVKNINQSYESLLMR